MQSIPLFLSYMRVWVLLNVSWQQYSCVIIAFSLQVNTSNETSDYQPSIPICDSDASFRPTCTLHVVNQSLQQLINLQGNTLPNCSLCKQLNEANQREMEPLREMVRLTLTELVGNCVSKSLVLFTSICFLCPSYIHVPTYRGKHLPP